MANGAQPTGILGLLGSLGQLGQIAGFGQQAAEAGRGQKAGQVSREIVRTALSGLDPFVASGIPLALGSLFQIVGQQGRTSPLLLNQELADIASRTQGAQQAFGGQLAGAGLGRSGVGQAIQAAIGQAGQEQIGRRQAQESALAEERRRADIQNLLNALLGPALGLQEQQFQRVQQGRSERAALTGQVVGGLAGGAGALALGCWLARAVWGDGSLKWVIFRLRLEEMPKLRAAYMKLAPVIAPTVRRSALLRAYFNGLMRPAVEVVHG